AQADGNAVVLSQLLGNPWPGIDDLLLFSRQMYSLTKAGVPLVRGLRGLADTTRNPRLREAIYSVVESLESGRELAGSLARHPRIFSTLFISTIRVGKNPGRLDEASDQLYHYLSVEMLTRRQVKSALRYPAFVIAAVSAAVVVLTLGVIPTFAQ